MHRKLQPSTAGSAEPTRELHADSINGQVQKRRRKIRSCHNCRSRKLYCDQVAPACGRCVKLGQAAECLYLDDVPASQTPEFKATAMQPSVAISAGQASDAQIRNQSEAATAPHNDLEAKVRAQDKRIADLEATVEQMRLVLAQPEQSRTPTARSWNTSTVAVDVNPETATRAEIGSNPHHFEQDALMRIKGKSFKTRFFGPSYSEALLPCVPRLGACSKDILQKYPALVKMRKDLQAFERHDTNSNPQENDIISLLPAKADCDELVTLYLNNYDSIYHIVHLPTFQHEYAEMWSTGPGQARPHFVALVTLMAATAQCLQFREPWLYASTSSVARERALAAATFYEDWVDEQSQKKTTIADFQIRFLVNLVRIVHGSRFKRTWMATGKLLRTCMAAGLHREFDAGAASQTTSALDREMRRRIWFAVVELELQASFDRGMVSSSWYRQSTTLPPLNVSDEETGELETFDSRPYSELTRTTYLSLASKSIMLRHTLNTALNDTRQAISFNDAKSFTEQIQACLRDIPKTGEGLVDAPLVFLSVTLRQYLLVLHCQIYQNAETPAEQDFARMIVVDNCRRIVGALKSLPQANYYAINFLSDAPVRVALATCYMFGTTDPQSDSALNYHPDQFAIPLAMDAVELIEDKVCRLGNGQQQLWVVLAAKALLQIEENAEQKLAYMQEAADGMSRSYSNILSHQENALPTKTLSNANPETLGNGSEVPPSVMAQRVAAGHGAPMGCLTDPLMPDAPPPLDLGDWPFDEWTFDQVEF